MKKVSRNESPYEVVAAVSDVDKSLLRNMVLNYLYRIQPFNQNNPTGFTFDSYGISFDQGGIGKDGYTIMSWIRYMDNNGNYVDTDAEFVVSSGGIVAFTKLPTRKDTGDAFYILTR